MVHARRGAVLLSLFITLIAALPALAQPPDAGGAPAPVTAPAPSTPAPQTAPAPPPEPIPPPPPPQQQPLTPAAYVVSPPPPPPPPPIVPHDGFMLRLTLGLGGSSAGRESPAGDDIQLSGVSGFFSLDIGAALVPGLILHGRLEAFSTVDPTVTVNGSELGEIDATLGFAMLAIAMTYYLPINLYFTGAIGVANATLEVDGADGHTDYGFGLDADIGYEAWLGDEWGLGVAGRFALRSVPAEDDGDPLVGVALGVLLTATYN